MRDIKFRAWDKKLKQVVDKNDLKHYAVTLDGEVINFDSSGYDYIEHFEIVRYTGLKDKNGVEIYEGDIVRAERNFKVMGNEILELKTFEVIYQFASFSLAADGVVEEFGYVYMSEYPPEKMEVIGSIHENPDLLDDGVKVDE